MQRRCTVVRYAWGSNRLFPLKRTPITFTGFLAVDNVKEYIRTYVRTCVCTHFEICWYAGIAPAFPSMPTAHWIEQGNVTRTRWNTVTVDHTSPMFGTHDQSDRHYSGYSPGIVSPLTRVSVSVRSPGSDTTEVRLLSSELVELPLPLLLARRVERLQSKCAWW